MIAIALAGCGEEAPSPRPVARVGGLVLDASVVEYIAARDGLDPAEAHARAVDILRLVAAGRERHAASGEDAQPLLSPSRVEHLRRAALARLWLHEYFEPAYGPDDIPDDDPRLVKARQDPRLVHPEIHQVCQVIVQPPEVEQLERKKAITSDPAWRLAAEAALAPVLERVERNVPPGDPEACQLLEREIQLSAEPSDPRLELSFPKPGGFDLDACVQIREADGECIQPVFDPEWTRQVRMLEPPGLSTPFFTQFGLHLVYLIERLPAQPAGEPATERAVREAVLDAWRGAKLDASLEQMGHARSVRLIPPSGAEAGDTP